MTYEERAAAEDAGFALMLRGHRPRLISAGPIVGCRSCDIRLDVSCLVPGIASKIIEGDPAFEKKCDGFPYEQIGDTPWFRYDVERNA